MDPRTSSPSSKPTPSAAAGATGAADPRWRCCAPRQLDGDAPEGVRRPANLEDAFVALTGKDIE